ITLANEGTKTLQAEQKPVALLCIGCSLIASSVLLLQKSIWKACYKTSKVPATKTIALVRFLTRSILTIVAMPHLDIVTNVTILNGVAVLSSLLQMITQCTAKERNRFLLPSITAFLLILLGYVLFLVLYIMKNPSDIKMAVWVGLAVGGSFLVSFNWWENYFRLISENSSSVFLKDLCKDFRKCQNLLHILSSLLRIVVTACVLGAYVPLAKMDWSVVTSIPSRETRIIAITVGVQLISSALCHWFAVAACKMHALRRCFIVPLYLASLAVMALLVIPVIVYYQDYRISLNGTSSINFTSYCDVVGTTNWSRRSLKEYNNISVFYCKMFSVNTFIHLPPGSAVSWWLGLVLATLHLWFLSLYRIQRTQNLFIRRLYEGGFLEQSLLSRFKGMDPVKVFLCATMWHETYEEMMKMIVSIFRLDQYKPKKEAGTTDVSFESHIYFDDAFRYVAGTEVSFISVISIFLNMDKNLFTKQQQVPDQTLVRTPYGGRVVVTLPHGNSLVVHFKDRQLIRHKKRWSQVMYLYYLLGWKVATKFYKRLAKGEDESELRKEFQKNNTYILALDGDTDFQPVAVMLLIDRLKLYPLVGAACGRIHPTGSGPMVWYQKFEYAVGHWLHKTAEHVFGCVLCSPGCFSLFRGAALMDDNVMKKYTIKASRAQHYIQYDQGEDRWLCTLLLKQGWRVEYNAASDAYTNAPEEFKEFYNQRRRWAPSTMANVMDLLGCSNMIVKRNTSMSRLYMLYQLFSLASSILSPSTVVLMIAGSLTVLLDIHPNGALIIAVIPPAIFLGISFKIKSDTQILIAGIMSTIYAFLMMISALVIVGNMVKQQTILTPSSIFIIALACFYLVTALLHPQEVGLVVFGLLYIICIPSAYLLLAIYCMVNMNNVSWGTRETLPVGGAPAPAARLQHTTAQKVTQRCSIELKQIFTFAAKSKIRQFFSRVKCCGKPCGSGSQAEVTATGYWINDRVHGNAYVYILLKIKKSFCFSLQEEEKFFRQLTKQYLEPLEENKKKQEEMTDNLRELRNKMVFIYFLCNALWLTATFSLQLSSSTLSIKVPKLDSNLQATGEHIYIDPVGFMFILSFALLVVIQFFGMLYHRIYTLIHYVAFLDTESKYDTPQQKTEEVRPIILEAPEANNPSDKSTKTCIGRRMVPNITCCSRARPRDSAS
uniref:chitin synthase n=1 Tax=Scophthalmus maximus TaxID=52904 RepID=A0A8D3D5U7_SCOMX